MYCTDPRTAPVCTLEGIRDRMLSLTDAELLRLAHAWRSDDATARARTAALDPDLPTVFTALSALAEVDAVFSPWATDARTRRGVHAVRDAVVAAVAGDALGPADARLLLAPWLWLPAAHPLVARSARLPAAAGPLLALTARLGEHCHDNDAYALHLHVAELTRDERHLAAADRMWAAVNSPSGQPRVARLAAHTTRSAYTRPHRCAPAARWSAVLDALIAAVVAVATGASVADRKILVDPLAAFM